jgi:hypothetical protein
MRKLELFQDTITVLFIFCCVLLLFIKTLTIGIL